MFRFRFPLQDMLLVLSDKGHFQQNLLYLIRFFQSPEKDRAVASPSSLSTLHVIQVSDLG